jgi:predicted ArsR family transcriptional regulator
VERALLHVRHPGRERVIVLMSSTSHERASPAALALADSVRSKHLKALEDAGYVKLDKRRPTVGRPRTWVALTEGGRSAFAGHLAELQRRALLSLTSDR